MMRMLRLSLPYLGRGFVGVFNARLFFAPVFLLLVLLVLLSVSSALLLFQGDFSVARALIGSASESSPKDIEVILRLIQDFRAPRILSCIVVGAGLGASGACLQAITKNDIVGPGVIGISQGTVFGIFCALVFLNTSSPYMLSFFGILGGIFSGVLIILLVGKKFTSNRLLLVGMGVSLFASACASILVTYSDLESAKEILIWLTGALHGSSWKTLLSNAPIVAFGVVGILAMSREIGLLSIDARIAAGLGINIKLIRLFAVLAIIVATSGSVAICGALSFVGLAAPHLSRFFFQSSFVHTVLGSMLFGSLIVLYADSLGKLAYAPVQIPAGAVTAIVGVPFLIFLLRK